MILHSTIRRRGLWLLVLLAGAMQWMSTAAQAQMVEAQIAKVKGTAVRYNQQRPYKPAKGDLLSQGDEIDTRGGGTVSIALSDGSLVVVQPGSRIVLENFRAAPNLRELFRIVLGRVRVRINHAAGKSNPYRVNSPTASVLVRGTEFGVSVEPSGDTRVVVYEGLVEVESLSDPRWRALVAPGRGVQVRTGEDLRFFTPGTGREISDRGNGGTGVNRFADQGVNAGAGAGGNLRTILANDYERYLDSIVEPGQTPPLQRFTAFPDSHFDSLDNPSYATGFSAMEGRFWLMPSYSKVRGGVVDYSLTDLNPLDPVDLGMLVQGTFFVPIEGARTVIGGAASLSSSRLQAFNETQIVGLPNPFYPDGVPGQRRSASSTETSSFTASLMAARRFGSEGRTSLGVGMDYVRGHGVLRGLTALTNDAGVKASEQLEAGSQITRIRFQLGLTHEFGGRHKLGLLYRRGTASAADRDRLRLFKFEIQPARPQMIGNVENNVEELDVWQPLDGLPLSLDSVQYAGRSSEIGFRLRGALTRRLFYGVEGSWLRVKLNEQIRRAVIVDSTERETIARADLSFGIGYALRRQTVLGADLAFGLSQIRERHYEDATGNLLEDERQRIPFASAHLGFQTDVWRQSFVSASMLAIRQDHTTDLALYPDRFGRRQTSYGLIEPDGRTRSIRWRTISDFGIGWRLTPNVLAEYILSVSPGQSAPRHVFLLRYTFKRER